MTKYEKVRTALKGLKGPDAQRLAQMIDQADDHESVDKVLDFANDVLGGAGVESLRGQRYEGYYGNSEILYVNMGDPYISTLMYDTRAGRFIVGEWGDLVAKQTRRFV